MVEIAYYITEVLKFLTIYVLGFDKPVINSKTRVIAAGLCTIIMGIVMNFIGLSIIYPVIYIFFAFLIFNLLIGNITRKNAIIILWAIGVIFSVDIISYDYSDINPKKKLFRLGHMRNKVFLLIQRELWIIQSESFLRQI